MTNLSSAERVAKKRFEKANGPLVSIRVLKRGDGKIATGELDEVTHMPLFHERDDLVIGVPQATADHYEEEGFAEIVNDDLEPVIANGEEPARRGPGRPPKVM